MSAMPRMLAAALAWAAVCRPGAAIGVAKPKKAGPFTLEGSCMPENRKSAADALLGPFEEQYASRVQEVFAGIDGPALLTIGDGHSNPLFFNFMAHVNKTAVERKLNFQVVNVALDELGHKACEANQQRLANGLEPVSGGLFGRLKRRLSGRRPRAGPKLHCVGLQGWLPGVLFKRDQVAGVKGTGTCPYNIIIWTKPHILKVAVQASSHGVLMIDTDVVVKGDLFKAAALSLAKKRDASFVTGIENGRADKVNTGTVFVSKTGRGNTEILDEWIKENSNWLNDDHGDQAALQAIFNVNHRLLQWAVTFGDAVGQCSRPAPVAVHYNCYANKLAPMRSQGDWDVATQSAREQLGLHSERGFSSLSDWQQRKIESLEAGGDWLYHAELLQ